MSRISVFACESQPIVLEGLAKVLSGYEDLNFIGSATALADTFAAVRQTRPDIILLDHSAGLKAVFGWRVRADPTLLGGSVDLAPAALLYDAS